MYLSLVYCESGVLWCTVSLVYCESGVLWCTVSLVYCESGVYTCMTDKYKYVITDIYACGNTRITLT